MAPSTFASAAASGNNQNSPRTDASSEWSRRPNGTTQTFRRPSNQVSSGSNTYQPRDSANISQNRNSSENVGVYIPPHRNGASSEGLRYSREQLLELFRREQDVGHLKDGVSDLYMNGWEPAIANGMSATSWGRRDDPKDSQTGAEVSWDKDGHIPPLALAELTEEEKELFISSVNSPIKLPTQQTTKESTTRDGTTRKPSVSGIQNSPGSFGLGSPTSRPGPRRRDTNESFPFPAPQSATSGMSRYSRDDAHGPTNPPASLIRRRTDFGKESGQEESSKEASPKVDTGSFALKRTTTGGLGSNTSAWAQTPSATFSPIGGAFGSFALSPSASTSEKRPGFGSLRGESKFKNLLKEANEQDEQTIREKASVSSLSRENWRESKDTRSRGNREMPGGDEGTSGSAALQGTDGSTPRLTSGLLSGIGVSMGQDLENDDSGLLQNLTQQTPHRRDDHGETLSPTNTNPYQSPENEKSEPSDLSGGLTGLHATHPGLGGFDNESESINPLAGLGSLGLSEAINERNQTTSAGMFGGDAFRGLAPLPGLGSASAWSATLPTAGTPTRERPQGTFGGAFGDSIFSPIENPAAVGPFPPTGFGPSNVLGGFGRGGRLGLLSNQAIDRSRSQESRLSGDTLFDALPHQDLSGIGPNAFSNGPLGSALPRDSDSPIHHARGFDVTPTAPPNLNAESSTGQLFTSAGTPSTSYSALAGPSAIGPQRQVQGIERPGSVGGGQPAAPLVRIMVMPDRMKWEYKDHQGQTQGPFSGLEMHDWYKAGYFTPELQIKKLEDTQFEPLAHLIRRIGNSREPFLVPQIGVPHDPPSNQRGWQTGGPGGIQPPFANSFPSFGTTLTAEQQNDLERRKQESQYLMARQKEYLAQQQQTLRMQQQLHPQPAGIFPPQLHHQASAQSLHSQPSFGSMTNAFAQNPSAPMMSGQQLGGIMENSFRGPGAPGQMNPLNNAHEEDSAGLMDNVNIEQQLISGSSIAGPLGLGPGPEQNSHAQQVAAMLSDRARLQMEAAEAESFGRLNQDNFTAQMAAERLQQFRDLQEDQEGRRMTDNTANEGHLMTTNQFLDMASHQSSLNFESDQEQSITQQVQAAVSAKASQPPAWQRIDMQSIIPPPQSTSPMPAPIAQRKHNVADKLTTAGSPSPSHTPVVETPTSSSIAPWAKEAPELPKASLKDIQEAEAKKAAKQEEIAAAARRAQLEKDILVAQQAAAAAAQAQPGLPSSSTWASSPAAASGNGASVWSKASAGIRTNVPAPGLTTKKTLQQIQKEEEARKQRAAVAGASAGGTAPISAALSSGKRYADLASKSSTVPGAAAPMAASAWTTVGAGGKVKSPVPSGPAPVTRSISGGVATSIPVQPARPKQAMRSTTLGATAAQQSLGRGNDVVDELKRWAVKELGNHLNKGLNVNGFVDNLLQLGTDPTVLTEAVHASSQTIDSRHFAEEFIRRRKLADKGISAENAVPALPPGAATLAAAAAAAAASSSSSLSGGVASAPGGGWSEVAKKNPASAVQEGGLGSFKVVQAKKKGGKR